jgi:hypothetical protein
MIGHHITISRNHETRTGSRHFHPFTGTGCFAFMTCICATAWAALLTTVVMVDEYESSSCLSLAATKSDVQLPGSFKGGIQQSNHDYKLKYV